ncbi:hypothetical protein OQJ15_16720 [Fluoribacter dumoffii]|uniref:AbiU2 domain-containing protein n=1 Tax=Fluoribacter dumoffii TaxID=463 RepID=UPI0022443E75|nr:hypothetical protein [Fluoribacter dumoffii]MCW8387955.1 hypothetical protein [Fluoribacter dumoffii]MCW8496925.1 hypothetical protein [Fluoribacter dumoffii]
MIIEEFKNLTATLIDETQKAAMHFDLYCNLKKSLSDFAMNKSPNFWSLTLNAHLEATRLSLCRSYDKTNKTNNIENWLKFIKDKSLAPQYNSEIEEDIKAVSKNNDIVDRLITKQRNNGIVHHSINNILKKEDFFKIYPLSKQDLKKLIDLLTKLINKYTSIILGTSTAMLSVFQRQDYKYILDGIKEKYSKSQAFRDERFSSRDESNH